MKNEYRGILAVVLSIGVLVLWYTVIAPPPPPVAQPLPPTSAPVAPAAPAAPTQPAAPVQPVPPALPVLQNFIQRPKGLEVSLENGLVKIDLDTLGGIVRNWELKSFTKNGKDSTSRVTLVDPIGTALEFLPRNANIQIPFPIPFEVERQKATAIDLKWESKKLRIFKRFRLDPNAYLMHLEVEVNNLSSETLSFLPTIDWTKIAHEESPQRGVSIFKSPPDRWQPIYYKDDTLKIVAPEKIADFEAQTGKIGWIGAESRYFLGSLIPISKFGAAKEESKQVLPNGEILFVSRLLLPIVQVLPSESWLQSFNVYGGPKELKSLKTVGPGIDKAIGYGWTNVIAVPILYLLKFFYGLVHNYGVAIILLTILVKILLNPINKKSLKSMKAMQDLQPKIKELQKKYGQDKQQLNLQTMQLFKTHKVNPMGGCLPMLLQFPIYIALYKVLWSSVELYHAPFLWFYKDLSAPDPFLITPLLLGVTMFIQTKMTPSPNMDPAQQKMMLIMPLMFCGIMVFLPMGLGLYILVNTVMTILQQKMYNKGIRMRDLLRGRWAPTA